MRPRVFPAEDVGVPDSGSPNAGLASMRPRVFPAEDYNRASQPSRRILDTASMRPRVFPAEDSSVSKPPYVELRSASMRPRVFPAEDSAGATSARRVPAPTVGFNEAAGIPRGRQTVTNVVHWRCRRASMRPRVFPAEDTHGRGSTGASRIRDASMRPRVFPAEDMTARRPRHEDVDVRPTRFNEAAGIPRGRHQVMFRSCRRSQGRQSLQ